MPIRDTLQHPAIVDYPPIPFPDLSRLGTSRIGRKLASKALDAYHVALRHAEGRPARSGPPIPNSEKRGRREYFTLEQVRYGNKKSLATRQLNAAPRHRAVKRLRAAGMTFRAIGEAIGYSAARCCQIVRQQAAEAKRKAMDKAAMLLNLHSHHQHRPDRGGARQLILSLIHAHHLLKLLDSNPARQDRARYEALTRRYKARILAYLRAVWERQGGDFPILEDSWAVAESVSGMPVDEAIRVVNARYGYGNNGRN